MSVRSAEFLTSFDGWILSILGQMCAPARNHFIALDDKRLARISHTTNTSRAEVVRSVRRLIEAGRIDADVRAVGKQGRRAWGVIALPRRARLGQIEWTEYDRKFLRSIKVSADEPELVPVVGACARKTIPSTF